MSTQMIIILFYLILTVTIGCYAKKKSGTSASFHGCGLGILMCVAAGTGEWLGGTSTTGISEYGFTYGISGAWYTIANGLGVMALAIFFAKLYRSLETVTVPGIIEKFIGVDARTVASVLLTFVMLAVGTAQIIAAGTLGVVVLGLDYNMAVIIMGLVFIVYTQAGGMIAVGYTNMIHLIAMYGGVILAIIFVSKNIGGLSTLSVILPDSYFSLTSIGMPRVSSWVIAAILGACTAQAGIQPLLAARDVNVAKKAGIITAFAVAPFGLLTALLGMVAKAKYPELPQATLALPTLLMDLNPIIGGIVLASILAAILSTVSPIILACGTMITKDIYQRRLKPAASDKEILLISRITTGVAGVCCIFLAIALYGTTMILDMVFFAYTIRGSLFVVLLYGIYWRRTTQKGAIYAMLLTGIVGFFWVFYKGQTGQFPLHPNFTETYAAVTTAAIATFVLSHIFNKNE
ncbi:sodium:solute symporter family protein [Desulfitibacter alkalitolerans]|uniref:sodium:solute symporter family protein n=1 Tax=Desulfitibacter alkalitolerans TaxID=264641 RepID=UPI0004812F28|nr:sodium:solute symporter family protein [Desulfitibacter alkalitolerans]